MARKENFTAYHLIDDEIHYPGHHEESGWDTDHRGAGGPYPGYAEFKGVKSIGNMAFDWCSNLTSVYYAGTEAKWTEITIGSFNEYLTSATIYYNHKD